MIANPMSLEGRTVVVTGAAQGAGQGVAKLCLELGANVVVIDVKRDELMAFAATAGKERCLALVVDQSNAQAVDEMVVRAVEKFGAIHGLVNNAAIVKPSTIEKMTMEQWHQVIDVDLTGVYYCLRAVGLHMVGRAKKGEKRPGSIVSIMSDGGRVGIFGQANYAAAKTGLLGLTMSAAREWAKYELRVNTISFGLVATPMTEYVRTHPEHSARIKASIPFGRYTSPEEVAKPICFMLSDAASYITGQNLSVNGGTVMAI